MSTYLRNIPINGNGNAGRVNGSWTKDGSPFNGTPALAQGDTLGVVVTWTGGTPPVLTGYAIIGPAPLAPTTQVPASPFLSGSNQVCLFPWPNVAAATSNGQSKYSFPTQTLSVLPSGRNQFELTFVAADPTGRQWEEDPEFDTGE